MVQVSKSFLKTVFICPSLLELTLSLHCLIDHLFICINKSAELINYFQTICRLWNLCAIGISALCIYNILVTLKLMYYTECTKNYVPVDRVQQEPERLLPQPCAREKEIENLQKIFNTMDLQLGRWDNKRMYKLFDNVIVGSRFVELNEQYLTTLATQTSLDKIISLTEVAKHWNGPISVAVFAVGDDELTKLLLYIIYLRQCFFEVQEKVTFHFAFPKDHIPSAIALEPDNFPDCSKPELVYQSLIQGKPAERWRLRLPYPQNHMRNLARKNSQTKFVFLTDVDIIPSFKMAENLDVFLREHRCKGKCAYVIPTYELDERLPFPPNKSELVRLAYKNLARPFHHKVFIYNQFATNFSR